MLSNNYTNQQPLVSYPPQPQRIIQTLPNNQLQPRPNSYDNRSPENIQLVNTHHIYNSPPVNLNKTVTYSGQTFNPQPYYNPMQTLAHQYNPNSPLVGYPLHQDIKFNYTQNQPIYAVSSQPIYAPTLSTSNQQPQNVYQPTANQIPPLNQPAINPIIQPTPPPQSPPIQSPP